MSNDLKHTQRPDLKQNDPNNLILIDGSGYIFRAFYGLPSMTNENGVPVNAVFGLLKCCSSLLMILSRFT